MVMGISCALSVRLVAVTTTSSSCACAEVAVIALTVNAEIAWLSVFFWNIWASLILFMGCSSQTQQNLLEMCVGLFRYFDSMCRTDHNLTDLDNKFKHSHG